MSDSTVDRLLLRDRWIVGGCLALLVALAGLWLWRDYVAMARWDESMAAMGMKDMEMEGGPMAGSSAPAAYLVEAFVIQQGGVFASTTVFAGFYLAVWGGFSALAALVQWAFVRSGTISDMGARIRRQTHRRGASDGGRPLSIDPSQNRLSREMPLAALVPHAAVAAGLIGAARLGLTHGLYCLGCCAMMMALLFVFGVMNLAWVACLAAVVLIEKVVPGGQRIGWLAGAAVLAVGLAMVLSPLTVGL